MNDNAHVYAGTGGHSAWFSEDGGLDWRRLVTPGISGFSDVNMGPTRVTQVTFDLCAAA